MRLSSFFFFQAEDGIRDVAVTGVQTCALPISSGRRGTALWPRIGKFRASYDISRLLSGGPTAWGGSEAFSSSRSGWEASIRLICSGAAPGAGTRRTVAVGGGFPIGVRAFNSDRLRAHRKMRWF